MADVQPEGADVADVTDVIDNDSQSLPPLTGNPKTIYYVRTRESPDEICYEDRTEAMESVRKTFESATYPSAWVTETPILDNQGAIAHDDVRERPLQYIPPSMLSREDIDDFELHIDVERGMYIEFHTYQLEPCGPAVKSAGKR